MKTIVASHNPDLARDFDRDLLRRHDLRLMPARNTGELLERLRQGADLCFLDRMLPDGDGVSALEMIRADKSLDALPVVLVVATGAPDSDPERAKRAGFTEVVELPAQPGALSLIVGRLLGVPLRRDERFAVRVHVFDSGRAREASPSDSYLGASIDLSEEGILVKTTRPVVVGATLQLRFALPGRAEELSLSGRVVRVDSESFAPQRGAAIQLTDLAPPDRAALHDYLQVLTGGRPFHWRLAQPEGDGARGRQTILLAGLVRGAADLLPLRSFTGEIDYRLRELERFTAEGVQHWIEFMRGLGGAQRPRLHECPVWFVQQANRIPNLLEGQELCSFFAPYLCEQCGLDQDRLLDLARDLDGGARRAAPQLTCDVCATPLALAEPADAYFALLENS